jgi:RNA polymerase subunit RPABC4/transcription elongation factor Spt4
MASYKHPCRYCDKLLPPDANVCPYCGRNNPLSLRCPKCRAPIEEGYKRCPSCGLSLETVCPRCGKITFFGDYCKNCDAPLLITCPNPKCKAEQPPVGPKCIKCGKPLK